MESYWNSRFGGEGKIWGDEPSSTAVYAQSIFEKAGVRTVLVPGAGYGRNAALFASSGCEVTGIEISEEALKLAERNSHIKYIQGSFTHVPLEPATYDALYCYNVLHLFRESDRKLFVARCLSALKSGGIAFFTVFSEQEASFGKGARVEEGTYESKPGRPVHYFTDADLRLHFGRFEIMETGLMDDHENHGTEGPHVHRVRYIVARKRQAHEFDGEKYRAASTHQHEWGDRLIASLGLKGDERILDLGCGDGTITAKLATLVPAGSVLGIDASAGMIKAAKPLEQANLHFEQADINSLDYTSEFDVVFSNATLHWVKDHRRMLTAVYESLKPGGKIRFNFGGEGNCQSFISAARQVSALPQYAGYFQGFQWPWYMPGIEEYRVLVVGAGFSDAVIELQNADRTFTEEALVKWIDQPSIVPFLAQISDEKEKKAFRDAVVRETMARTKASAGGYFETFRRIDVQARK